MSLLLPMYFVEAVFFSPVIIGVTGVADSDVMVVVAVIVDVIGVIAAIIVIVVAAVICIVDSGVIVFDIVVIMVIVAVVCHYHRCNFCPRRVTTKLKKKQVFVAT